MTASLRVELRSRERRFDDARVIANGLTVGQLYALGELEFASVHPGLRSSTAFGAAAEATTRQERGFADLFKAALDVIPSTGAWADFASQSGRTVVASPLDFFAATATGVRDYIEDELKGYADIATGVGSWLADAGACVLRQIPLPFLEPDAIGGSESCNGLKQVAKSVQTVLAAVEKVRQLGFARLIEMGKAILDFIGEMFSELLTIGMDLLRDWKAEVEAWLRRIAASAKELGNLLGMLLGSVLMEWLTAGVGRALKSARAAKKLPVAALKPDATVAVPSIQPSLPGIGRGTSVTEILDELAKAFQQVIARNHPKLTRRLNARTHADLIADLPVPTVGVPKVSLIRPTDLRGFVEHRDYIFNLIKLESKKIRGRISTHRDNRAFQEPFNRNVITAHQADALTEVDMHSMDAWEIEGRKGAMLPDVFESNHIYEQRVILQRFDVYQNESLVLGWTKVNPTTGALEPDMNAMTSILMPSQEHTSSATRMFKRMNYTDDDMREIVPELGMPESITTVLKKYIHIEDGTGNLPNLDNPPKFGGTLLIRKPRPGVPATPFKEILEKLEAIYRSETPHLWKNPDQPMDLFRQFNEWRRKLGYPPNPF